MQRVRRLTIVAAVSLALGYLVLAAFFFAMQRKLLFQPQPPQRVVLPGAQLLAFPTDGGTAHALWLPGPDGAPVVVHFHGNAEQLADLDGLAARWHRAGLGFFAVELPGYGASSDRSPSESACYADARAAIRELREQLHIPREQTVLEGRSLGTGIATELASQHEGARLILVSPYTSIADVAAQVLPFLPARWMARDRFDSLAKAPQIEVPVLVLHGRDDGVIPFVLGERLARAFPHARFVPLEGGHDDALSQPAAWGALVPFALGK